MKSKVFGIGKDSTLTFCRAKPENRGKGNCNHSEHMEVTAEQLRAGFIQSYNEKVYSKKLSQAKRSNYASAGANSISSHGGGKALSYSELEKGSNEVAATLRNKDFEIIQKFYEKYERVLEPEEETALLGTHPVIAIKEFLDSDDPHAVELREFLGKDVDTGDLSEVLVMQIGAMTFSRRWQANSHDSMQRIVLTTLKNDMSKRRYVASVLFFGGRCCYCNRTVSKYGNRLHKATAEHITPIAPQDPKGIVGGTRYGNMALACQSCNQARGNEELTDWVRTTDKIRAVDKAKVLGRIKAFREFALYEEYSQEESDRIRSEIARLSEFSQNTIDRSKPVPEEDKLKVKREISMALYELSNPAE